MAEGVGLNWPFHKLVDLYLLVCVLMQYAKEFN